MSTIEVEKFYYQIERISEYRKIKVQLLRHSFFYFRYASTSKSIIIKVTDAKLKNMPKTNKK